MEADAGGRAGGADPVSEESVRRVSGGLDIILPNTYANAGQVMLADRKDLTKADAMSELPRISIQAH